jgi:hypothetical protein
VDLLSFLNALSGDGVIDMDEFLAEVIRHPSLVVSLTASTWNTISTYWTADYSLFRAVRGEGGSRQLLRSIMEDPTPKEAPAGLLATVENSLLRFMLVDPVGSGSKPGGTRTVSGFFRMLLKS